MTFKIFSISLSIKILMILLKIKRKLTMINAVLAKIRLSLNNKKETYNGQVIAVLIKRAAFEDCFFIFFSHNIKRIRLT